MENNLKIQEMESISFEKQDLEFLHPLAQQNNLQYFNIRFSQGQATTFSLMNKVSKNSNTGIGFGFSVHALSKNCGWGFAIGHDFTLDEIQETFINAAKLANWSGKFTKDTYAIKETDDNVQKYRVFQQSPLSSVGPDEKMRNLLEIEQGAYENHEIISTRLNYYDGEGEQVQYNNFGRFTRINSADVLLSFQAVAKEGQNQQGYHVSAGGIGGYEVLKRNMNKGKEAAQNAIELLQSKPIEPGQYNIVMDPALTGTFIHEAFGHATEADGIIIGESVLADKLNQQVGNTAINIIDDGTLEKNFGFIPFDSEGTPAQKTTLVKNGELIGYLHSLETSSKMGVSPTGNARSSGYSNIPQVRMTNTYLAPGDASFDEILQEMKNGLLCVGWKYGYVEPSTGEFMFKMAKAYKIENGEKTQLYRDAAISGITLEVLKKIDLISNDLEQDPGHCGKGGQSVPVGSGGPYTSIKNMIIGGQ